MMVMSFRVIPLPSRALTRLLLCSEIDGCDGFEEIVAWPQLALDEHSITRNAPHCPALSSHSQKRYARPSRNPENLVGLQAQSPPRMLHAVIDRQFRIRGAAGPIHRLQEKMPKVERTELIGVETLLWKDQFQFLAGLLNKPCAGLWPYATPIQARWRRNRPIRFDRNFKPVRVKCVDQRRVHLQQRFAARANHKPLALRCFNRTL